MILGWFISEGFTSTVLRYSEHYNFKQWKSVVAHSIHGSFVFALTVIMISFFCDDATEAYNKKKERAAYSLDDGGKQHGTDVDGGNEHARPAALLSSPSAKDKKVHRVFWCALGAGKAVTALRTRIGTVCGPLLKGLLMRLWRLTPPCPPVVRRLVAKSLPLLRIARGLIARLWALLRAACVFLVGFVEKPPSQRDVVRSRWIDFQRSPWLLCASLANCVPWLVYAPTYNRYTLAPSLCAWIQIFPGPAALVTTLSGTTQCYTTLMAVLVEGKITPDMKARQRAYAILIQMVGLSAAITKGGVLSVPRCMFDAHQTMVETSISLTLVLIALIELKERTWDGFVCFVLTAIAVAGCITFDQCFCTFYGVFEILGAVAQINYLGYRVARKIGFDTTTYAMQVLLLNFFSWLLNQILLSFCIHYNVDFARIGSFEDGMPDRLHQVRRLDGAARERLARMWRIGCFFDPRIATIRSRLTLIDDFLSLTHTTLLPTTMMPLVGSDASAMGPTVLFMESEVSR